MDNAWKKNKLDSLKIKKLVLWRVTVKRLGRQAINWKTTKAEYICDNGLFKLIKKKKKPS